MPCQASRLTLELAWVRIQRLQEISDDDAFAEGIDSETDENGLTAEHRQLGGSPICGGSRTGLRCNPAKH